MITLQRPDAQVSALLGEKKGINKGDKVRPSLYAIPFKYDDVKVVYNSLTCQIIETPYFSWFENPHARPFDPDDSEMSALVSVNFLVDENMDEASRFSRLLPVLRRMSNIKPGYTAYTILPTTACNARCFYCYEQGIVYETMSDEVTEQVIKYIVATKRKDSAIGLHWFGGEPLIGERIIDRICEAMRDAEINYRSNMISNGSLVTAELAKKAKEDWNVSNIQITLDGREEEYCRRKNYPSFEGSPYRAVLDGIHELVKNDIRVSIRLNADESNLDELYALADEMEQEFADEKGIRMYVHSIFRERDDVEEPVSHKRFYDDMEALSNRLNVFNERRVDAGTDNMNNVIDSVSVEEDIVEDPKDRKQDDSNDSDKEEREKCYDKKGYLRRYYCMADNPSTGPVIMPDGKLHICEHVKDLPVVGKVFDETSVKKEDFITKDRFNDPKCRACAMLPKCLDFTSCPTLRRDCFRDNLQLLHNSYVFISKESKLPPVKIYIEDKVIRVKEPSRKFVNEHMNNLAPDYIRADDEMDEVSAIELLG